MPSEIPYQSGSGETGLFSCELPGQVLIEVPAKPTPGDIALLVTIALIVSGIIVAVFYLISIGGNVGRWCLLIPLLPLITIATLWRPGDRSRHHIRLDHIALTIAYQAQSHTHHYQFPRAYLASIQPRSGRSGLEVVLRNGQRTYLPRFPTATAEAIARKLNDALAAAPDPSQHLPHGLHRHPIRENPFPLFPP